MPAIRAIYKDQTVEFFGSVAECSDFLSRLIAVTPLTTATIPTRPPQITRDVVSGNTETSVPNMYEVIDFIKAQPNYSHSTPYIHERFLGKTVKSQGRNKKLYFKMNHLIERARKQIEETEHGKFHTKKGQVGTYTVYSFRREAGQVRLADELATPIPESQTSSMVQSQNR